VSDANPRWQYAEGDQPDTRDAHPQQPRGDYEYGYDPYPQHQGQYQQGTQQGQPGYADQQQFSYPDRGQYPERPSHHQPQPEHYGQQAQQYRQSDRVPPQPHYPQYEQYQGHQPYQQQLYYQQPAPAQAGPAVPGPEPGSRPSAGAQARLRQQNPGPAGPEANYQTEQFAFVDEADEESDEVIDWLKFTESRTERRDERKRRGRNRVTALLVVLVLALAGGVGYLWKAGMLPGIGVTGATTTAAGDQRRDVIVVHLRPVGSDETSTALLVDNSTTHKGYLVLLPNALAISTDDGSTTLGKSVVDDGAGPTRDALSTLLGTDINGTWRLDTPYLELLVEGLGDITVDTDATVKSGKGAGAKTLVTQGKDQDLNGQAAVAYATYRAPGETEDKQLARFGQVMDAVLKKMPSDTGLAVKTVQSLGAVPDPSLSQKSLGASLAALAEDAKTGAYSTTILRTQADGTLRAKATDGVVKDILGGAVKNADSSGTPSVSVQNASGAPKRASSAQVAMVNSGYTYVDGGAASTLRDTSRITYSSAARKADAEEVAKTLGLSTKLVARGTGAANADITVVLGKDYAPGSG
jgi:hypothetical protein